MALPAAPANLAVRPGPEPQTLYVNADAVTASPTVDSYTVYVDPQTGVSTSQYRTKKALLVGADNLIRLGFESANYYVTITATNSEGEGLAATEVKIVPQK